MLKIFGDNRYVSEFGGGRFIRFSTAGGRGMKGLLVAVNGHTLIVDVTHADGWTGRVAAATAENRVATASMVADIVRVLRIGAPVREVAWTHSGEAQTAALGYGLHVSKGQLIITADNRVADTRAIIAADFSFTPEQADSKWTTDGAVYVSSSSRSEEAPGSTFKPERIGDPSVVASQVPTAKRPRFAKPQETE